MHQDASKFFSSCWNKVSELKQQLPQLQEQLAEQLTQRLAPLLPAALGGGGGEEVAVGPRRLRVLRKLGEGGYSFVYLAREILPAQAAGQPPAAGQLFALKKVLAAGREQLAAARHEVEVTRRLDHPNLLPLLDAEVAPAGADAGGGVTHVVHMLFPLYVSAAACPATCHTSAADRTDPHSYTLP
jgi:serine/threonine kinase 16